MTHGSATVPDPLHPLHRHDVGACELPLRYTHTLPGELERARELLAAFLVARTATDEATG